MEINVIALRGEGEVMEAAGDHGVIPRRAVLLVEAQEIARIIGACREPRGIEEHECE